MRSRFAAPVRCRYPACPLMLRLTFIRTICLLCVALSVSCSDTSAAPSVFQGTEVELTILTPTEPIEVDVVSYRISCPASGLVAGDDSVDETGFFEIDDTAQPPVWELITDLPPTVCILAMWVFDDDEVVCSGSQTLEIEENGDPLSTNRFDIQLVCELSEDGPQGDVAVEGSFELYQWQLLPKARLAWRLSARPRWERSPCDDGPSLLLRPRRWLRPKL